MNDILKTLIEQIVELETERQNKLEVNEDTELQGEQNVNFAQFVNSSIDSTLKKLIFKSQLTLIYGNIILFYFQKKLYITLKKYHIGIYFDISLLPEGSVKEMDEAITYIFMKAKPTMIYGLPEFSQQKAVEFIGKIIDKYLYNKTKYFTFILDDLQEFNGQSF